MVNTLSFTERKRVRKNFGKLKEVSKFPNLIEIQKKSYEEFLLEETHPSKRPDRGLQKVFKSVFPLELCPPSLAVLGMISTVTLYTGRSAGEGDSHEGKGA